MDKKRDERRDKGKNDLIRTADEHFRCEKIPKLQYQIGHYEKQNQSSGN